MPDAIAAKDHIYKILELVGSSEKSIEDAIQNAITRASWVTTKTLPSATTGSLKCTQSVSVLPLVHSRLPVSASYAEI